MNQQPKMCLKKNGRKTMLALTDDRLHSFLAVTVCGVIGNSVTTSKTGKAKRTEWMEKVAKEVKHARGNDCWTSKRKYFITVGFCFHNRTHGNQKLDIENYLKPTIDAIAAGLFCKNETDIESISEWAYDDSCFRHLLVHRLPDAKTKDGEGITLVVNCVEDM